jgi:hypothetical protein
VAAPLVETHAPRYRPVHSGSHQFNQTAQTFAYLKQRVARGELVLEDPVPLDSFGRRETTSPA